MEYISVIFQRNFHNFDIDYDVRSLALVRGEILHIGDNNISQIIENSISQLSLQECPSLHSPLCRLTGVIIFRFPIVSMSVSFISAFLGSKH